MSHAKSRRGSSLTLGKIAHSLHMNPNSLIQLAAISVGVLTIVGFLLAWRAKKKVGFLVLALAAAFLALPHAFNPSAQLSYASLLLCAAAWLLFRSETKTASQGA